MDRCGLVGAMPVGNRWRSQGYLDGSVRYLGTFDTEEEAHAVYMAARNEQDEKHNEAQIAEHERVLSSPTYVYKGGVGRGAALNGRTFKVLAAKDEHSTVVVEIREGNVNLNDQRVVLNAYLEVAPKIPAPQTVDSAVPAPETNDMLAGVRRFINSGKNDNDIVWAFKFLEKHAREPVASMLEHLRGTPDLQTQIEWLRVNTRLPPDMLEGLGKDYLDSLWDVVELQRQDAVVKSRFR